MLEELYLRNVALIDESKISFHRGLNILTGETGAGKSAILTALGLLLGDRVDLQIIRKGAKQATIQGLFSIERLPHVKKLLQEHGIFLDGSLPIRKEVYASGKSQLFIADRFVTLAFAKTIGDELLEVISQSSYLKIRSKQNQLEILDLFGGVNLAPFQESFKLEKNLTHQWEELKEKSAHAAVEIERLKWSLEKIEAASPQPGEEEALYAEYKRLHESQQLAENLTPIQDLLQQTLLPALSQCQKLLTHIPNCPDIGTAFTTAHAELSEASFATAKKIEECEANPNRFSEIDQRLALFHDLKKRFHKTSEELPTFADELKEKIQKLEKIDEEIAALEEEKRKQEEWTNQLAQKIKEARSAAAKEFSDQLTKSLRALNMPEAKVEIILESTTRSQTGDDKITIHLSPNPGEKSIPLEDGVSGGEIARVYFSMKCLIAKLKNLPTLLFDEIDANMGGQTAKTFGEKLQELSQHCQVIVITHFPQVAQFASRHFKIEKRVENERTLTLIQELSSLTKHYELERMLGL